VRLKDVADNIVAPLNALAALAGTQRLSSRRTDRSGEGFCGSGFSREKHQIADKAAHRSFIRDLLSPFRAYMGLLWGRRDYLFPMRTPLIANIFPDDSRVL